MKKMLTAALLAAVAMPVAAIPTAASAQSARSHHDRQNTRSNHNARQDRRHDARQNRNQQRHVRQAQRQRHDARQAHRYGNNDWRGNRANNRRLYARGNWRAPFRYHNFRSGIRIGASYYAPRYRISDPWRYHLPSPGWNQVWVRHYNDLLLVDTRRGYVIRVIRNFYW